MGSAPVSPRRVAAIDVGTNTVLLLVAEQAPDGNFRAVRERAEITRLGRGVDRSGRLDPAAIQETVGVLAAYATEARALGASGIACVATSAARDASNGAEFFDRAFDRAGVRPDVISGEEEARLVYASAWRDFGATSGVGLAVVDVGGGSTELTWGDGPQPRGRISLQIGAVRLTERIVTTDPLTGDELGALRDAADGALRAGAASAGTIPRGRLVGVAGTVTTLAAVRDELATYDAERVHGSTLHLREADALLARLGGLTVAQRQALPGMEPKRADVIVAGCAIVIAAMRALEFDRLTVSDRGVRWGLLYDRFGA